MHNSSMTRRRKLWKESLPEQNSQKVPHTTTRIIQWISFVIIVEERVDVVCAILVFVHSAMAKVAKLKWVDGGTADTVIMVGARIAKAQETVLNVMELVTKNRNL